MMFNLKVAEAILLSRNAESEIISGNTHKAKQLYIQAGDLLMEVYDTIEGTYEKNATNYSAAVLYFNGGEYQKCLTVAGQVNGNSLKNHRDDLVELYKRAKERSHHYPSATVQEIQKTTTKARENATKSNWERLLNLLREHPYALRPLEMMKLRCEALTNLNRHEEAELFKADMERLKKSDSDACIAESPPCW